MKHFNTEVLFSKNTVENIDLLVKWCYNFNSLSIVECKTIRWSQPVDTGSWGLTR